MIAMCRSIQEVHRRSKNGSSSRECQKAEPPAFRSTHVPLQTRVPPAKRLDPDMRQGPPLALEQKGCKGGLGNVGVGGSFG